MRENWEDCREISSLSNEFNKKKMGFVGFGYRYTIRSPSRKDSLYLWWKGCPSFLTRRGGFSLDEERMGGSVRSFVLC